MIEGKGNKYSGKCVSFTARTVGFVLYRFQSCPASKQAAKVHTIRAASQNDLKNNFNEKKINQTVNITYC